MSRELVNGASISAMTYPNLATNKKSPSPDRPKIKRTISPEWMMQIEDTINDLITSHAEIERKYREMEKKLHGVISVDISA